MTSTTNVTAPYECGAPDDPSIRRVRARLTAERRLAAGLIRAGASDNRHTAILAADVVTDALDGNKTALGLIEQLAGPRVARALETALASYRREKKKK